MFYKHEFEIEADAVAMYEDKLPNYIAWEKRKATDSLSELIRTHIPFKEMASEGKRFRIEMVVFDRGKWDIFMKAVNDLTDGAHTSELKWLVSTLFKQKDELCDATADAIENKS